MSGAITPLPKHAFMAWCSVKAQGQLLPLPLPPVISCFETPSGRHSSLRVRDKTKGEQRSEDKGRELKLLKHFFF